MVKHLSFKHQNIFWTWWWNTSSNGDELLKKSQQAKKNSSFDYQQLQTTTNSIRVICFYLISEKWEHDHIFWKGLNAINQIILSVLAKKDSTGRIVLFFLMDKRWGARNNTKGLSFNRQVGKYPLIGIICVNGIDNRNNDISFTTVPFLFTNIVLNNTYIYIYMVATVIPLLG